MIQCIKLKANLRRHIAQGNQDGVDRNFDIGASGKGIWARSLELDRLRGGSLGLRRGGVRHRGRNASRARRSGLIVAAAAVALLDEEVYNITNTRQDANRNCNRIHDLEREGKPQSRRRGNLTLCTIVQMR